MKNIRNKKFPLSSGVYLMKNKCGEIIYVGKALVLRNRIKSYFQDTYRYDKTSLLMKEVFDIDYIITPDEPAALILEEQLIKQYMPRYNIRLKDDKKYPYIQVSIKKKFPRIRLTRDLRDNDAEYFGPYTSPKDVKHTLTAIKKIYPLLECNKEFKNKNDVRACLYYHIHRCPAPCNGKISEDEYRKTIKEIRFYLKGYYDKLIHILEEKMFKLSKKRYFESAATIRDKICSIRSLKNKKYFLVKGMPDTDMVFIPSDKISGYVYVWSIREGRLLRRNVFEIENRLSLPNSKILNAFISQQYLKSPGVPQEIWVCQDIDDFDLLKKSLKGDMKIKLIRPLRGKKKQKMKWMVDNIIHPPPDFKGGRIDDNKQILIRVKELLGLSRMPTRIEAFDVSNIQGKHATASMVCFYSGEPLKNEYRRFKIKTVAEEPNDVAMLKEAVMRRYKRLRDEGLPFPDLVLVDGGQGQVNAAYDALHSLELYDIPAVGLAKKEEIIYFPRAAKSPVKLPDNDDVKSMFQRVRDESHRFALKYHRLLRKKNMLNTGVE